MKNIVSILTMATLFYTTTIKPNGMQPIRAVKEFSLNPLKSVTVTLSQSGQEEPTKQVTFKRNTDGLKQQLSYNPAGDRVTISAQMSPNGPRAEASEYPNDLADKEIHIIKAKDNANGFDIELKPTHAKKVVAPKKQLIRAYKPNKDDQQENWTVVIFDNTGDKIATSTFKENTDYKAKKLYLQLNQQAVDLGHQYSKYNDNIITIYSSTKEIIAILKLNASSFISGKFTAGSSLAIAKNSIDIVDKTGKSLLTDLAKAEQVRFLAEYAAKEVSPVIPDEEVSE